MNHIRRTSRLRNDDGQSMVEFALLLPILLVVALGIMQFGIIYNNYITLTDATRVGARQAAVSRFANDQGVAATAYAKNAASGIDWTKAGADLKITATDWTAPGSMITVTATYPYSVNLLGFVVGSGLLKSTTHERLE
jgi:Flp pilus assembly protein TadG